MIDLTPLDVRKKRGDFAKSMRGYDPREVDIFLELVSERMEVLVKENLVFQRKIDELVEKVVVQEGREQAIQDALVTAQQLRQDVKKQALREAKVLEREARGRIEAMIAGSEKVLNEHRNALQELERQRERFLKAFRTLLERELDTVEVEFGRAPLEDITLDLELGQGNWSIGEADDDEDDDPGEGDDEGDGADADKHDDQDAHDDQNKHDDQNAHDDQNKHDDQNGHDDREDAGPKNGQREEQSKDNPPSGTGSDPREAEDGQEDVDQQPPEGKEGGKGDDSLWLSSIMADRKDADAG